VHRGRAAPHSCWARDDRALGIGLGDLTELHADVAFAHIRALGFREHANAAPELRRYLLEHRLHDRGHAPITITFPIQNAGAPDTLLRMRSAPLGMRVMRRRASFISAPAVFTHSCRMASARGSVSIGTPNAFATQSAVIFTVGRPDPAGGEDIGVAMPERIECVSLLVANHPHFLEVDADDRQIFRDIADVLVLGAAGQGSCHRSPGARP
jgi:hypothetical protein